MLDRFIVQRTSALMSEKEQNLERGITRGCVKCVILVRRDLVYICFGVWLLLLLLRRRCTSQSLHVLITPVRVKEKDIGMAEVARLMFQKEG